MSHYLSQHPDIFMSEQAGKKEPGYFCPYKFYEIDGKITSWDEYMELFSSAPPHIKFIGDASTRYLRSDKAVLNILDACHDPRFVVMLRNPVDLAARLHNQRVKEGKENLEFEDAWRAESVRMQGHKLPPGVIHWRALAYAQSAMLGAQLQRLFDLVDRNKVHCIFYDDFQKAPEQCYHKLLDFLRLSDDGQQNFPKLNASITFRWTTLEKGLQFIRRLRTRLGLSGNIGIHAAINRFNTVPGCQSIRSKFRRELQNYFRDDIVLLSELTGRDLSSWYKN